MAGHSKWANIRYRKTSQDAKRDKIFTKIIRDLVTATRIGGANLDTNPRLRTAVGKALSKNMTRDTLNRAIARGTGCDEGNNINPFIYEGYGPGGVAMIVKCLSDNRNRTTSLVRHAFNKHGGNLGMDGSVSYLFSKIGIISFENSDETIIMEVALEAGANDVITYSDNNVIEVISSKEKMTSIRNSIELAGITASSTRVSMVPSIKVEINKETQSRLLDLIYMLEDCDDVQEVFHNGKLNTIAVIP